VVTLAIGFVAHGGVEAQERPRATVAAAQEDVRLDGVLDEPRFASAGRLAGARAAPTYYNALEDFERGWQLDTSQFIVKVQYAFRY
jgi:hypothetical protein